jgi:hypothetical protein
MTVCWLILQISATSPVVKTVFTRNPDSAWSNISPMASSSTRRVSRILPSLPILTSICHIVPLVRELDRISI